MADDAPIDQQVYDELIAQGKSERVALAKARAAALRQQRQGAPQGSEADDRAQGGVPAAGGETGGRDAPASGPSPGAEAAPAGQERVRQALATQGAAATGSGGAAAGAGADGPAAPGEPARRRLGLTTPPGIQTIKGKQEDKVYTWPHLISSEFVALLSILAFLLVFSSLVDAPLQELANPTESPNPAKAPWYFLGLQELLLYFHPMVAGVTLPGAIITGLIALPYLDRNPSQRPENRRTALTIYTLFLVFWATLTITGSFFRGPGLNWVWPWVDGIWFNL